MPFWFVLLEEDLLPPFAFILTLSQAKGKDPRIGSCLSCCPPPRGPVATPKPARSRSSSSLQPAKRVTSKPQTPTAKKRRAFASDSRSESASAVTFLACDYPRRPANAETRPIPLFLLPPAREAGDLGTSHLYSKSNLLFWPTACQASRPCPSNRKSNKARWFHHHPDTRICPCPLRTIETRQAKLATHSSKLKTRSDLVSWRRPNSQPELENDFVPARKVSFLNTLRAKPYL
jgi:hypothetical protein